mgnify:CR=1 FL=1
MPTAPDARDALFDQRKDCLLRLIGERKVLHALLPTERRQIVVQILAEGAVGEPEKFKVKPFEALSEHLQLAKKTELLKFDVAQQPMRFGQMQRIQQKRAVDDETTPAAADRRANAATAHMDSSIITEAAPSEVADFSDTRMPPGEGLGSGRPVVARVGGSGLLALRARGGTASPTRSRLASSARRHETKRRVARSCAP